MYAEIMSSGATTMHVMAVTVWWEQYCKQIGLNHCNNLLERNLYWCSCFQQDCSSFHFDCNIFMEIILCRRWRRRKTRKAVRPVGSVWREHCITIISTTNCLHPKQAARRKFWMAINLTVIWWGEERIWVIFVYRFSIPVVVVVTYIINYRIWFHGTWCRENLIPRLQSAT